jgi:hypothetical protein
MALPDADTLRTSPSFVYPVRSLLNGTIQPARDTPVDTDTVSRSPCPDNDADGVQNGTVRRRSLSHSSGSSPNTDSSLRPKRSRRRRGRKSVTNPNFRHYPNEDDLSPVQRTFTSNPLSLSHLSPDLFAIFSHSSSAANVASAPPTDSPTHPPNEDLVEQPPVDDEILPPAEDVALLPWNPSEYGLVHLPPLPPSGPSSHASTSLISPSENASQRSPSVSNSLPESSRIEEERGGSDAQGSSQSSLSNGMSDSVSGSDASDASRFVTVRFQHIEDANGNHVVTGREGKLSRCEDEVLCINSRSGQGG